MSKEQTQQWIGKPLSDEAAKDAIHIAVAPMVARVKVFPGQHVGLAVESDLAAPHVGIVDPFLQEPVFPGQRYFLFLYPNTITSLRHEAGFSNEPQESVATTLAMLRHEERRPAMPSNQTAEQVAEDIIWRCYQNPAVVKAAGKPPFRGLDVEIAAALESYAACAVAEEREACAALLDEEVSLYKANAAECDRAGNSFGGSMDTVCQSACMRMAAAIRKRGQK